MVAAYDKNTLSYQCWILTGYHSVVCSDLYLWPLIMDFEPCAYMNSILSLERQPKSNEILILVCVIAAKTNKILVVQLERFWQGIDFCRTGLVVVSCHCGKIGMHYALF